MRTIIPVILIYFLFGSCKPTVTFDGPQPEGVSNLEKFPNKLQGDYASQKDNSILTVREQQIVRTNDWDFKEGLKDLDSDYKFVNGHIVSIDGTENYPAQVSGDSIEAKVHEVDTIFKISEVNILRKFKGYYFLNERGDKTFWSVIKASSSKGLLTLGKIAGKDEIDKLREITETTSDTTSYIFKPTHKQFKKFIRQNGFSDEVVYKRIKK